MYYSCLLSYFCHVVCVFLKINNTHSLVIHLLYFIYTLKIHLQNNKVLLVLLLLFINFNNIVIIIIIIYINWTLLFIIILGFNNSIKMLFIINS